MADAVRVPGIEEQIIREAERYFIQAQSQIAEWHTRLNAVLSAYQERFGEQYWDLGPWNDHTFARIEGGFQEALYDMRLDRLAYTWEPDPTRAEQQAYEDRPYELMEDRAHGTDEGALEALHTRLEALELARDGFEHARDLQQGMER